MKKLFIAMISLVGILSAADGVDLNAQSKGSKGS